MIVIETCVRGVYFSFAKCAGDYMREMVRERHTHREREREREREYGEDVEKDVAKYTRYLTLWMDCIKSESLQTLTGWKQHSHVQ